MADEGNVDQTRETGTGGSARPLSDGAGNPPAIDRDQFLGAMRLVPGAVAIIATAFDGVRGGLAATAWDSLTADPPTVLACINESASAHNMFLKSKRFSINLLPVGHEETVAIFSRQRGLEGDERFLSEHWGVGTFGMPILNEAVVALECALTATQKVGTHTVLFGEVRSNMTRPETSPLLYVKGGYARAESQNE